MNIKELQLQKAENEAILQSIKKGRIPILSIINTYLKNKFKFSPAGTPSFKPIIGKKYDVSNSNEFNKMLSQIHSDLSDLFDADNYINNQILSTCNYYEAEKTRLGGLLNKLQNELDNIMTIIDQPQIASDISDTFGDFNKIDFTGNGSRNIAKTNAYVDLRFNCVNNGTVYENKINLKECDIQCTILTDHLNTKELSDIKQCINDNANETWVQSVATSSNDKLTYNVGIQLKEEVEINTVSYTISSPRKQKITLNLLDKDGNRYTYNTITTVEKAEWNFKNVAITTILFEIEKQECDATNGVEFDYYIGAKNIGIYNNTYKEKTTFVSKGEPINNPFSQIVFVASEDVPASTNITYYVGIDNGKDSISWLQVQNKTTTELNLLPRKRITIQPEQVIGKTIAKLNEKPIKKTTKVYVGADMWQVRTSALSATVSPKDIFNIPISAFEEMDYIKYKIKGSSASIYTTYADFDESCVVEGNFIGNDIEHAVYVNGAKVIGQQSSNSVKYKLRMAKGTNQIQVLVINRTTVEKTFKFDAYLQEYSSMVRAINEAKEVDAYELQYALHRDTFEKFTVSDQDVIVNYDASKYPIRYIIDYRYNDKPSLFENANLRVMAVLYSKNQNVTPKVFSYQAAIL